jgi:DNA-binding transcriptional LysR family regulator
MDRDLNDVLAFTAVADSGSFTRAAERLGWPKSSVSHRVARLERLLGARLLERSTRRLRLTDVGARYHEHARRVLQELDAAAVTVASFRAQPQGWLRVSASVVLGQSLLPRLVAEFATLYPDSSLVSRRLGQAAARLFAAPSYLRLRGKPTTPSDLSQHVVADNAPTAHQERWTLIHDDGSSVSVPLRFQMVGNDPVLLREWAVTGAGIVSLPVFVAAPAVAQGSLVAVLPAWATRHVDVQVVFPSHKSLSPALRAFVDLAALRLGDALRQA